MNKKVLYKVFVSKAKNKKYSVYVKSASGNPKLIHFGDSRYGQFKDKLGHYKSLDHGDQKEKRIIIQDTEKQLQKILLNIGVIKYYGKNAIICR